MSNLSLHVRILPLLIALMLFAPACFAAGNYPDDKPLPQPLTAEKTQSSAPSVSPSPDPAVGDAAGKLLAGFGVLAVIFFGLVWFVRRNPSLRRYLGAGGPMKVLSRVHLGGRQQVFLLMVGDRVLVVGSGSQGLRTLSEIREPSEVARLAAETGPGQGREFKTALRESITEAERDPRPIAHGEPVPRPSTNVLDRAIAGAGTAAREKLAAIRAELERITPQPEGKQA